MNSAALLELLADGECYTLGSAADHERERQLSLDYSEGGALLIEAEEDAD